jgi:long-chain acyl-CoA synthetase
MPNEAPLRWRTAVEMFESRVTKSGALPALRVKEGGAWRARTWREWDTASREIGAGLRALGVENGDRVCILAGTRAEWVEADVGILLAGAVTVPIYQSNTPRECEYIISDCKARVVFVEDVKQLDKLRHDDVRAKLDGVKKVILMTGSADDPWVKPLAELRSDGKAWLAEHTLDAAKNVGPDDIFTIVYTSGTTGPPKGVVLTHGNICYECEAIERVLKIGADDEQLLFLPLAHIFAKILEWVAIGQGCVTAFAESIPQLIPNMKEVRPTFMGAVPRVYEKAYATILGNLSAKRQKAVSRLLIDSALAVGKKRDAAEQARTRPSAAVALGAKLADRVVFGKIQATFGGRLRFFVSGGAPLAREIAEFFASCGILILEGYGLTETTAATHVNQLERYRLGTVGPALPGVEVKLADDKEILVRGPNILREYYGNPGATSEAVDADGWFHTGDIGVVEDGFLRITDRKKDLIVTAGGKNVAPQNIEGALKAQCPYVSQVVVQGDRRPYLVALITVNPDVAGKPDVESAIAAAVQKLNAELASYETIKKYKILPNDLSQEAGELTPSLKVKRKFVAEKYKDHVNGLYEAENP